MNRRDFIKAAVPSAALATWTVNCKYEEKEHDPKGEEGDRGEVGWKGWDYRVYCYERKQGEWTFSQNIRGSFAHQREYITFEEDELLPHYAGWMDGGKLHSPTLDDAQTFVECHTRTKDDTNLTDSIYDIYYLKWPSEEDRKKRHYPREIQVAHFWFNGDTGRQVSWNAEKPYTDWGKVECS